jgi:ammonia channel protein AmtB
MEIAAAVGMVFINKKKRSTVPIVRRKPGQSLHEKWDRLINENLPFVVFAPGMLWFAWFTHWIQVSDEVRLSPNFWLALAITATGVAAIAYFRLIPKGRRLVRGERG